MSLKNKHTRPSRREREILEVLHRRGRATAAEVQAEMADAPSYSSVRALLATMERKGQVRHEADGPRYVYLATQARRHAGREALRGLVQTFFEGSPGRAAAALLDETDLASMSEETLERLEQQIANARRARKEKS